jgi:cell division protein FtsB
MKGFQCLSQLLAFRRVDHNHRRGRFIMDDDLILGLTREVKEEVIENYLTERRLLELQIENLREQAKAVQESAKKSGLRLTRLGYLMIHPDMLERLKNLLGIQVQTFWLDHLEKSFHRGVRFIRVRAFRDSVKFKKLVLEAYHRLRKWMKKYHRTYQELEMECQAVNRNIENFHKNFDLLSILSFLRGLDTSALERKHFMGENFTPEEMASVDQKLYIPRIAFQNLDVPAPLILPHDEAIAEKLGQLAGEVYAKYQTEAKWLIQ